MFLHIRSLDHRWPIIDINLDRPYVIPLRVDRVTAEVWEKLQRVVIHNFEHKQMTRINVSFEFPPTPELLVINVYFGATRWPEFPV